MDGWSQRDLDYLPSACEITSTELFPLCSKSNSSMYADITETFGGLIHAPLKCLAHLGVVADLNMDVQSLSDFDECSLSIRFYHSVMII